MVGSPLRMKLFRQMTWSIASVEYAHREAQVHRLLLLNGRRGRPRRIATAAARYAGVVTEPTVQGLLGRARTVRDAADVFGEPDWDAMQWKRVQYGRCVGQFLYLLTHLGPPRTHTVVADTAVRGSQAFALSFRLSSDPTVKKLEWKLPTGQHVLSTRYSTDGQVSSITADGQWMTFDQDSGVISGPLSKPAPSHFASGTGFSDFVTRFGKCFAPQAHLCSASCLACERETANESCVECTLRIAATGLICGLSAVEMAPNAVESTEQAQRVASARSHRAEPVH